MLAVVTVDTNLDTVDFNDGVTSLREAIFSTNLVGGADTIDFDASLDGATILLTQGEMAITESLTIHASSLISGNSVTGRFATGGGIYARSGTTIINGSTISDNSVAGGEVGWGAGMSTTYGNLTVTKSTITGNSTSGGMGYFGSPVGGGGVLAYGGGVLLSVENSIIAENTVDNGFAPDLDPGSSPILVSYSLIGDNTDKASHRLPLELPT